jgi:hypothetical protein
MVMAMYTMKVSSPRLSICLNLCIVYILSNRSQVEDYQSEPLILVPPSLNLMYGREVWQRIREFYFNGNNDFATTLKNVCIDSSMDLSDLIGLL